MRYRYLGKWGLKVSEIALGAWVTYGDTVHDKEMISEIVKIAYDGGVNFFDNADIYAMGKAEEIMGEILADYPRHTLVLSTKAYWPMSKDVNDRGLSRKHIRESIHKSLRRFNTDYVDLFFAHRYDQNVPMEEIVTSFSGLVDEGKILYWGTSEWPASRLAEASVFAAANGSAPTGGRATAVLDALPRAGRKAHSPRSQAIRYGGRRVEPAGHGDADREVRRGVTGRVSLRRRRGDAQLLLQRGQPGQSGGAQRGRGRVGFVQGPAGPGLGVARPADELCDHRGDQAVPNRREPGGGGRASDRRRARPHRRDIGVEEVVSCQLSVGRHPLRFAASGSSLPLPPAGEARKVSLSRWRERVRERVGFRELRWWERSLLPLASLGCSPLPNEFRCAQLVRGETFPLSLRRCLTPYPCLRPAVLPPKVISRGFGPTVWW